MPTKHPRHIVTETGPVADALSRARRVRPDVHVRDLVLLGAERVVEDEERRLAAIERLIARSGDVDEAAGVHVHDVLGMPEHFDG